MILMGSQGQEPQPKQMAVHAGADTGHIMHPVCPHLFPWPSLPGAPTFTHHSYRPHYPVGSVSPTQDLELLRRKAWMSPDRHTLGWCAMHTHVESASHDRCVHLVMQAFTSCNSKKCRGCSEKFGFFFN